MRPRQKINSLEWYQLRDLVCFVARTFHYESSAKHAIFAMIRKRFGTRARELPAACLDDAMALVQESARRADAFMDIRWRLEKEAIRRIFGSEPLAIAEEEVDAAIGQLGTPMEVLAIAETPSNVIPFPGKSRSEREADDFLSRLAEGLRERGYEVTTDTWSDYRQSIVELFE